MEINTCETEAGRYEFETSWLQTKSVYKKNNKTTQAHTRMLLLCLNRIRTSVE